MRKSRGYAAQLSLAQCVAVLSLSTMTHQPCPLPLQFNKRACSTRRNGSSEQTSKQARGKERERWRQRCAEAQTSPLP